MEFETFVPRRTLAEEGLLRPDRAPDAALDRTRRGVYVPRTDRELGAVTRYLRQVLASNLTLTGPHVYSHESAAALLGLPVLGAWPDVVHLIGERRSGGRSQLDVVRHCLGLENVPTVRVGGLLVTSPARTALDIALSRGFESAVVVADAVLRSGAATTSDLRAVLAGHAGRRGHARAAAVFDFADGGSGSPGESVSRVRIDRLGFLRPVLQLEVVTDDLSEFADFGWPTVGAFGEFDGEVKYRLDRYRRGGTVDDVVVREKNRENRMRRRLPNCARWDWRDLHRPGELERILLQAHVPRVRAPRFTR